MSNYPAITFDTQPLNTQGRQIRLIQIDYQQARGAADVELLCVSRIFNLADAPEYTALSYCWGDKTQSKIIMWNSQRLRVGDNLRQFLLRWARGTERKSDYLWIDQLSIDQSNLKERSHQVAFMGQIYVSATKTIVWLGDVDGFGASVERDGDNMHAWVKNTKYENEDVLEMEEPHRTWMQWSESVAALDIHLQAESQGRQISKAARAWDQHLCRNYRWWDWLLNLPYWTRLWIVQEICLSRDIMVWIGCNTMSWDTFTIGLAARHDLHSKSLISWVTLRAHRHDFFAWLVQQQNAQSRGRGSGHLPFWQESNGETLLQAINRTASQECENALDVIFALGSLLRTGQTLDVDYSMSCEDLLRLALIKVLRTSWVTHSELHKICGLLFRRLRLYLRRVGYRCYVSLDGVDGIDGTDASSRAPSGNIFKVVAPLQYVVQMKEYQGKQNSAWLHCCSEYGSWSHKVVGARQKVWLVSRHILTKFGMH